MFTMMPVGGAEFSKDRGFKGVGADRYRLTMAARYSRLARGLMGTNTPFEGIVPVT